MNIVKQGNDRVPIKDQRFAGERCRTVHVGVSKLANVVKIGSSEANLASRLENLRVQFRMSPGGVKRLPRVYRKEIRGLTNGVNEVWSTAWSDFASPGRQMAIAEMVW